MTAIISKIIIIFFTAAALLSLLLVLPGRAVAQEEVTSNILRYKDRETSTGYYEEYEVLPSRQRPLISVPGLRRGTFPYSPTAAQVRIRTRLPDSHQGIKFYEVLRCEYCHAEQAKDIHRIRANISCRQCHGGEPIASIEHFYSPLNPIRRHAYVCAKCHEGAGASFASYVIHEPAAGSPTAKNEFPLLYYSYWFMLVLLVGTLAFFIPHTLLVGVTELLAKLKKPKRDDEHDEEIDDQQHFKLDFEPSDQRDSEGDDPQGLKQDIGDMEPSDGRDVEQDEHDKQEDLTDDEWDDKHKD